MVSSATTNGEERVLSGRHFMLGNYAVAEGALAAGCDFFAGYPITPANEISERMARRLPAVGGKFVQAEDELFSIYSIIGASLSGARAMTATASAGFNYMQEGIGYAVAVEAPVVIVDVMRCRGENFATQSDVMQFQWGASGDYEIVCLAPASVQELFDFTVRAFNLAEKYRTPVVVMSETTISLMRERLEIPAADEIELVNRHYTDKAPGEYLPYQAGEDGVPGFAPLGQGYNNVYSLNPHDEAGGIDWDPDVFEKLYERISGKITRHRDDICSTQSWGLDDADLVLVAYGSESRPAYDAMQRARDNGMAVGLLKLDTVWPVPEKQLRQAARQARKLISVEMNMGKYGGEIERAVCGLAPVVRATKNRGLIHSADEIYKVIEGAWE